MNITTKALNEVKIFNSWDVTRILKQNVFIKYYTSDNGRLTAHYAFWRTMRFEGDKRFTLDFTVTCRENKEPELKKAIDFIKRKTGIEITDKVLGDYHPKGTIEKLNEFIKSQELNKGEIK